MEGIWFTGVSMVFNRKEKQEPIAPAPLPPPAPTVVQILEQEVTQVQTEIREHEAKILSLNSRMLDLDQKIAWLRRYPFQNSRNCVATTCS